MSPRALAALVLAALAPLPAGAQEFIYHPPEELPPLAAPPGAPAPPPGLLGEPRPVAPLAPAAPPAPPSLVEVRAQAVRDADAEGSLGWAVASASAACGAGCLALVLVGASATVPVLPCVAATALGAAALTGAAALAPTTPDVGATHALSDAVLAAYGEAYAGELRFNRVRAAFIGGGAVVAVAALALGAAALTSR